MTKNSLKTGPDELGYYGEGDAAMGGMAVGETLMPALHELSKGFEDAIKDKEFLDEYAYYCKHYIGRSTDVVLTIISIFIQKFLVFDCIFKSFT